MRSIIVLLLVSAAWISAEEPIVLADFEGPDAKSFESPPHVTVVPDHAKHGSHSLRVVSAPDSFPGLSFQNVRDLARFRERPLFCMDIFNPDDRPVKFCLRADDARSTDYGSRVNDDGYLARPGWSTLRVNLTGLLRSNSRNFHEQVPLDLATLRVFTIFLAGNTDSKPHTLYFDDARLEGTGLPEVAGLRAFDFGPAGSGVFAGFTAVTEKDLYAAGHGYGWGNPLMGQRPGNPDDLGGDYGRGDVFTVDLKDGAGTYVVDMCIDTFGAWAQPQLFKHRVVTLNGASVLDETWDGEAFLKNRYFRFEKDEDEPGMDLWERRVKPANPVRRFEASVGTDGRLAVTVRGDPPMGDALCFLCVYPKAKAKEGAAFMRALDERRRDLFQNEISLSVRTDEHPAPIPTADEQARGFIAFVRTSDIDVYASAVPVGDERKAPLALAGCAGEMLAAQVGFVPLKPAPGLTATVSDLIGSHGSTIPSAAVELRVVRNFAKRGGQTREAILSPMILEALRPLPLKPGFTRALWVTVHTPIEAKAGTYLGTLTIAGGARPLTIPLSVTVHPFTLDPADDISISCSGTTAGNLRSAYPGFDAAWWRTAEAVMQDQAAHGLNAVSGGPSMRLVAVSGGKAEIDFDDADRWMALAAKHGLTKRGDSYQGFDLELGFSREGFKDALAVNERRSQEKWGIGFAELIRIAYGAVALHAKQRGWPLRSYALIDEPRIEFGNIEESRRLIQLYTSAAPDCAFSGLYAPGDGRDPYFSLLPVSISHHTAASLKQCVEARKEAWDYSAGGTRYDAGRWLFFMHRQGLSGFVRNGWMYVNSDPYFDFSDTEGSWAQVYPSSNAAGFVATVMWERTATGLSDYRYLKTLTARIAAAKATGRDTNAAESFLEQTLHAVRIEDSSSAELSGPDTAAFRANLVQYIVALTM